MVRIVGQRCGRDRRRRSTASIRDHGAASLEGERSHAQDPDDDVHVTAAVECTGGRSRELLEHVRRRLHRIPRCPIPSRGILDGRCTRETARDRVTTVHDGRARHGIRRCSSMLTPALPQPARRYTPDTASPDRRRIDGRAEHAPTEAHDPRGARIERTPGARRRTRRRDEHDALGPDLPVELPRREHLRRVLGYPPRHHDDVAQRIVDERELVARRWMNRRRELGPHAAAEDPRLREHCLPGSHSAEQHQSNARHVDEADIGHRRRRRQCGR